MDSDTNIGSRKTKGGKNFQSSYEVSKSKKWTEEEETKLLYCLQLYGHKNLTEIGNNIKTKSREEIKKYLITAHAQARKRENPDSIFSYWLSRCTNELKKKNIGNFEDSMQIPQIVKYLSIDGLLENHPLPENCGGIDFQAAYRLLYQALMGYPLQPVNKATAEFVCQSLDDLKPSKYGNLFDEIDNFIRNLYGRQSESSTANQAVSQMKLNPKPLRIYQRKRPSILKPNPGEEPVLKIVVKETDAPVSSGLKTYTVGFEGKNETTICVPVAARKSRTELEEAIDDLRTRKGFNPLTFPDSLLKKPSSSSI